MIQVHHPQVLELPEHRGPVASATIQHLLLSRCHYTHPRYSIILIFKPGRLRRLLRFTAPSGMKTYRLEAVPEWRSWMLVLEIAALQEYDHLR